MANEFDLIIVGAGPVGMTLALALKDSGKPFPLNQSLGILRWRYTSKDAGSVPLSSKSLDTGDVESPQVQ